MAALALGRGFIGHAEIRMSPNAPLAAGSGILSGATDGMYFWAEIALFMRACRRAFDDDTFRDEIFARAYDRDGARFLRYSLALREICRADFLKMGLSDSINILREATCCQR